MGQIPSEIDPRMEMGILLAEQYQHQDQRYIDVQSAGSVRGGVAMGGRRRKRNSEDGSIERDSSSVKKSGHDNLKRGRPRLDTRDETPADVGIPQPHFSRQPIFPNRKLISHKTSSVGEPKSVSPSGHIVFAKKIQFPPSVVELKSSKVLWIACTLHS